MSPFPVVVLMLVWVSTADKPFDKPGHWQVEQALTDAQSKEHGFKSAAAECGYKIKIDTDTRRCVWYTPRKVVPLMDTSWMRCARGPDTDCPKPKPFDPKLN